MGTAMRTADEARRDDVDERAGGRAAGQGDAWEGAEVLLVANRTRGATHKSFRDWRFEVVAGAGQAVPGTPLFAVPLDLRDLAAAGWRYEFRLEEERPGPAGAGRAAFSWAATTDPGTPDPLAAALGQVRAWLTANDWEQDPQNPTRYHR